MTKKEFESETTLIKIMNNIKEVGSHTIACVMFHNLPWKVVTTKDFNVVADRSYEPVAAFRTRNELWQYLKTV